MSNAHSTSPLSSLRHDSDALSPVPSLNSDALSPEQLLDSNDHDPPSTMEVDSDEPAPTPPYDERSRRRTPKKKLYYILGALREARWSMGEFVAVLYEHRHDEGIHRPWTAWRQLVNAMYVDLPTNHGFKDALGRRTAIILEKWGLDWATETLRREIQALCEQSVFGLFEPPSAVSDLGSLSLLKDAPQVIQSTAPQWLRLLTGVCQETRTRPTDLPPPPLRVQDARETIMIFGILCHLSRRRRSTNFQTLMGLYLYQGGTRRRVLETLNQLGITISYRTLQRRMNELVDDAKRRVRLVGKAPGTVVSWDNFEFTEGRRGERVGDSVTFRSITTALLTEGRLQRDSALSIDMWRPQACPLSVDAIVDGLRQQEIPIRAHHIESAIKSIFGQERPGRKYPWVSKMPEIHKLSRHKTKFLPLQPILRDESTTANNIKILENIFQYQFSMESGLPIFNGGMRIISGDLKTWARIQSAKSLRGDVSVDPFDTFGWVTPIIGLWHLRYNMLQLIHRIHWGESKPSDPSTLQYAADRWQRSRVVQANDFQAIEDLIIHSYQARVVGTWLRCLADDRLPLHTHGDGVRWLESQNALTWELMLKRISGILKSPTREQSRDTIAPILDQQFHNHQLFCAHVEIYLTLRYAIKVADIGLLRHALRYSTIIFQASAARAPKYGRALLYMLHLVQSTAAAQELQESVLADSLVNLRGDLDTNFELDRLLELLNNNLKAFQHDRTYYSKNSDELLQRWALNGPFLLELKLTLEACLGSPNSSRHPEKSAAEDIWGMAVNLWPKSLRRQNGDRFSLNPAADLVADGLDRLGESLLSYNEQYYRGVAIPDFIEDDDAGLPGVDVTHQNVLSPTLAPIPDNDTGLLFVE